MANSIRSFEDAKRVIAIPDFLAAHGHSSDPKKSRGEDLWYCSPWRTENTPSLHVFKSTSGRTAGYWVYSDLGDSDRGGTIIDLAMRMEGFSRPGDALNWLRNWQLGKAGNSSVRKTSKALKAPRDHKPTFTLISAMHLVPAYSQQIKYCENRGIPASLAMKHLCRIHFRNNKVTSGRNEFFAVGMANRTGEGYEVRNAYFQAVIGSRKDLTLINESRATGKLYLFEGMFDYLSYLQLRGFSELPDPVVILNSVKLAGEAVKWIQDKKSWSGSVGEIFLFMDNDEAGQLAKERIDEAFQEDPIEVTPMNHLYDGHKDLNAYLVDRPDPGEDLQLRLG